MNENLLTKVRDLLYSTLSFWIRALVFCVSVNIHRNPIRHVLLNIRQKQTRKDSKSPKLNTRQINSSKSLNIRIQHCCPRSNNHRPRHARNTLHSRNITSYQPANNSGNFVHCDPCPSDYAADIRSKRLRELCLKHIQVNRIPDRPAQNSYGKREGRRSSQNLIRTHNRQNQRRRL